MSIMLLACRDGDDECGTADGDADLAACGDDNDDFVNWQVIYNQYVILYEQLIYSYFTQNNFSTSLCLQEGGEGIRDVRGGVFSSGAGRG